MKQKKNIQKKHSSGRRKSHSFHWLKYIFILLFVLLLGSGLFVYSIYAGLWGQLPTYEELRNIRNDEASELYSEDGELIGKYYIENRTNVNFNHISENAVNALIATEDVRFYEHDGVDRVSMLRVFFKTFLLGDRSSGGGSTLSQQLAKNIYPREDQQVSFMPVVKLKEMFTARRLENIYSKDEILTLYLNTVFFGENTFGIESAAQKYFSTSASELSVPQAATLIGMLKGPSRYNPRLHPERALQRRNTVIGQMIKYNFLTADSGHQFKEKNLALKYKAIDYYSGLAPYLREKIRQDAIRIIDQYNRKHTTAYNLYKDGLILTTTLDAEMQQYAEEAVQIHLRKLQDSYYAHLEGKEPWDHHPEILKNAICNSPVYRALKSQGLDEKSILKRMNEKKAMLVYSPYQGEARVEYSSIDSIKHYLKILQPAMIAVEAQTGKVKAWVGGANYKYFQYDQVDAPRQVGSVFKPVVYSAAIRHGARLDAYYKNEQKTYPEYDDWTPRNADNNYEGYYTLKGALSKSINTIAVDVLLQTGIDTVIAQARQLGIQSDLPPYPSLALGVADIPLREMIHPFLCFANSGVLVEEYYLKEIKDRTGKIIFQAKGTVEAEVLPATDASIMNNILAAVIDEGTGQKLRTNYGLHNEMAGKTGTTQNQVDGWFIGYNPRIVVGIRVGANDVNIHFNSIRLGQGASMALPIFGEFMQRCLKSHSYGQWSTLTFPMAMMPQDKNLDAPEFKDHLNMIDQMKNRKLERVKDRSTQEVETEEEVKPQKGIFRKIGNWFRRNRE
ncbi:MAG: transglycosylase domain-containing protein [Odoribacter sp.]